MQRSRWLPLLLVFLLLAIIALLIFQFKDERSFAVVKLSGDGTSINMSKSYDFQFFGKPKARNGALLAEKGDLLGFNNVFLPWNDRKKDSMAVDDEGDSLIFVNGKIHTILISDKPVLLPWFRNMKAADLSNLEMILFNSTIPISYIPYLQEIARVKPGVGLAFEEDDSLNLMNDYFKQANFFSPRFIKASLTQDQFGLITGWQTVESMYLDVSDSVITKPLPSLPALKRFILYGDDIQHIDASFFSNNKQVEKLTLLTDLPDYAVLQPLKKIQELTINNDENSVDAATLKQQFSNLSVLIVSGACSNIDSVAALKKLRWLGLPENTSQQQFNSITVQLTGLQVLELTGSENITNLAPLQQLPNLKGLVITDTVTDKQSLYSMKALRYLSLPQNNSKDSMYLVALEKALPGCIVVPNGGACMGSGWLLLVFPLVILCSIIFHRKVWKAPIK